MAYKTNNLSRSQAKILTRDEAGHHLTSRGHRAILAYLTSRKMRVEADLCHLSPLLPEDQRSILMAQGQIKLINDLLDNSHLASQITKDEEL